MLISKLFQLLNMHPSHLLHHAHQCMLHTLKVLTLTTICVYHVLFTSYHVPHVGSRAIRIWSTLAQGQGCKTQTIFVIIITFLLLANIFFSCFGFYLFSRKITDWQEKCHWNKIIFGWVGHKTITEYFTLVNTSRIITKNMAWRRQQDIKGQHSNTVNIMNNKNSTVVYGL